MIPRQLLTVYRVSEGQYVDGIWQPGTETSFEARYSVQPTDTDDLESLPEGRRQQRAYTLIGSTELRGLTDANPDQVEIDGERYEVSAVRYWRNGIIPHTWAIVTRLEE